MKTISPLRLWFSSLLSLYQEEAAEEGEVEGFLVGLELLDLGSALPRVRVLFLRLLLRLLREYKELRSSWDFRRDGEDLRGEGGPGRRLGNLR